MRTKGLVLGPVTMWLRGGIYHIYHYWIDEYMPIVSYDEETGLVLSSHYSIFSLTDDFKPRYAKYTIDNVLDGLQDPGDWYLSDMNMKNFDFNLAEYSPAYTLGFKPIDMSDVGVRAQEKR